MSRIQATIAARQKAGQKCFVAYLSAGDPDLAQSFQHVEALVRAGVDIIELGVPFSDPLADGPTNQRASERALAGGTNLRSILAAVKAFRTKNSTLPLVLFSYLNPIYRYGFQAFAQDAQAAGIDGVLVVDFPPEEAGPYREQMQRLGLDTIFLASPTSDSERLSWVARQSQGFVYYVSRTGVTGTQTDLSLSLEQELKQARQHISLPLMVGFGISNAEQARQASTSADGIVIGSALVQLVEQNPNLTQRLVALEDFARSIRQGLDQPSP